MVYEAYAGTAFPHLRTAVRPDLAALPDAQLGEAIAGELGADAAALEDFMSGLRSFGNAVAARLPAIAQGAVTGASTGAIAGPYGALIGGLGGALVGGLTAPAPGATPPSPPAPRPAAAATFASIGMPQPAPTGPAPSAPAAGGGAAASLMGLLANPMVQQALMQMMLGRAGAPQVSLPRGEQVPVAAFAEMVREVADQALAEQQSPYGFSESHDLPEYLAEWDRRRTGVRDDPTLRAAILLKALEPPQQAVPVVTTPAWTPAPAPAMAPTTWATGPAIPGVPGAPPAPGTAAGEPFVTYVPPDTGGTGPTVYTVDENARALADWEFEQAIEEILGGTGRG